jgi:hypothetical protein
MSYKLKYNAKIVTSNPIAYRLVIDNPIVHDSVIDKPMIDNLVIDSSPAPLCVSVCPLTLYRLVS